MKRVLITGGTGFLGTNLYQSIKRGRPDTEIEIFSRRTGKDVRNYQQVEEAVKDKEVVIHAAAQTHVDFSLIGTLEDQNKFNDTNIQGTLNVIHACKKYHVKMIHISTSEVYGSNLIPGKPMTEEHPLLPQAGIYATSKAAADLQCRMMELTTDVDLVILRPFNYWGPHQSVEKFIPKMIRKGLEGPEITICGSGEQMRDYVHIVDVCRAVWAARALPSGTICNISTNKPIKINQIAKYLSEILGKPIRHVDPRVAEVAELRGDNTKIKELLGWNPTKFITKEALEELVSWYKVNQTIVQPSL